jgi:hypothetical protein
MHEQLDDLGLEAEGAIRAGNEVAPGLDDPFADPKTYCVHGPISPGLS